MERPGRSPAPRGEHGRRPAAHARPPQRDAVRHYLVGAPLLHDPRRALDNVDPAASLAHSHGRVRGRGIRARAAHERLVYSLLRAGLGRGFLGRSQRDATAGIPRLRPRSPAHCDRLDFRTHARSHDSPGRGARPVDAARRVGRHAGPGAARAPGSAPRARLLPGRRPHPPPTRARGRHPRVDADLGRQSGVGLSLRRGRGRLPRGRRRRADRHGPRLRGGNGLAGHRRVLLLHRLRGPDARPLLDPRGPRAGRPTRRLDDHAGRRGIAPRPARPRVQRQGLPGRAHRHEPRDARRSRGRVDHLGGMPARLERPDHRYLAGLELRQGPAGNGLHARRRSRARGPRDTHSRRSRRPVNDSRRHLMAACLPGRPGRRPHPGRHAQAHPGVAPRHRVPHR